MMHNAILLAAPYSISFFPQAHLHLSLPFSFHLLNKIAPLTCRWVERRWRAHRGRKKYFCCKSATLFAWVYQSTWVPKITKSAIATTVQRWFQGSTGPTGTKGNHRNVSFDCQRIHFVQLALHNLFSRKGCFDLFSSIVGLCLVMMMH